MHSLAKPEDDYIYPNGASMAGTSAMTSGMTLSPTKRISERFQVQVPPESPDTKFARNRLGNLLSSIQKGDSHIPDKKRFMEHDLDKRGPGRPKKINRGNKEVQFEIRGKSFAIKQELWCTEYQLCRAWLRGKMVDPEEPPFVEPPPDPSLSVEYLATRDILSLPRAAGPLPTLKDWPEKETLDQLNDQIDPEDGQSLMHEYVRHWREVKKSMRDHARQRSQRHQKSIALLETVYNYAQQNHMM